MKKKTNGKKIRVAEKTVNIARQQVAAHHQNRF
jgi:hypothetical protein